MLRWSLLCFLFFFSPVRSCLGGSGGTECCGSTAPSCSTPCSGGSYGASGLVNSGYGVGGGGGIGAAPIYPPMAAPSRAGDFNEGGSGGYGRNGVNGGGGGGSGQLTPLYQGEGANQQTGPSGANNNGIPSQTNVHPSITDNLLENVPGNQYGNNDEISPYGMSHQKSSDASEGTNRADSGTSENTDGNNGSTNDSGYEEEVRIPPVHQATHSETTSNTLPSDTQPEYNQGENDGESENNNEKHGDKMNEEDGGGDNGSEEDNRQPTDTTSSWRNGEYSDASKDVQPSRVFPEHVDSSQQSLSSSPSNVVITPKEVIPVLNSIGRNPNNENDYSDEGYGDDETDRNNGGHFEEHLGDQIEQQVQPSGKFDPEMTVDVTNQGNGKTSQGTEQINLPTVPSLTPSIVEMFPPELSVGRNFGNPSVSTDDVNNPILPAVQPVSYPSNVPVSVSNLMIPESPLQNQLKYGPSSFPVPNMQTSQNTGDGSNMDNSENDGNSNISADENTPNKENEVPPTEHEQSIPETEKEDTDNKETHSQSLLSGSEQSPTTPVEPPTDNDYSEEEEMGGQPHGNNVGSIATGGVTTPLYPTLRPESHPSVPSVVPNTVLPAPPPPPTNEEVEPNKNLWPQQPSVNPEEESYEDENRDHEMSAEMPIRTSISSGGATTSNQADITGNGSPGNDNNSDTNKSTNTGVSTGNSLPSTSNNGPSSPPTGNNNGASDDVYPEDVIDTSENGEHDKSAEMQAGSTKFGGGEGNKFDGGAGHGEIEITEGEEERTQTTKGTTEGEKYNGDRGEGKEGKEGDTQTIVKTPEVNRPEQPETDIAGQQTTNGQNNIINSGSSIPTVDLNTKQTFDNSGEMVPKVQTAQPNEQGKDYEEVPETTTLVTSPTTEQEVTPVQPVVNVRPMEPIRIQVSTLLPPIEPYKNADNGDQIITVKEQEIVEVNHVDKGNSPRTVVDTSQDNTFIDQQSAAGYRKLVHGIPIQSTGSDSKELQKIDRFFFRYRV